MDPRRFLDLAVTLKGGPATAEWYRTAIGRAYYAAFNVGVESIKAIGIRPKPGPSGHGDVRNCLGACSDRELRKASARLRSLHGRRIIADYEMSDPGVETRNEADTACMEANEIIDIVGKLASNLDKDIARMEIRQAARDIFKLTVI
jgi:HEPN domain